MILTLSIKTEKKSQQVLCENKVAPLSKMQGSSYYYYKNDITIKGLNSIAAFFFLCEFRAFSQTVSASLL